VNNNALQQKLDSLSTQDKRALFGLSGFLLLVIMYMVSSASYRYQQNAVEHFSDNRDLLHSVYRLPRHSVRQSERDKDKSLLSLASSTAKLSGMKFKRVRPMSGDKLQVELDAVPFNSVLAWLHKLEHWKIRVESISVDTEDMQGYVRATIVVKR
jgi:general secretion pathway protein M